VPPNVLVLPKFLGAEHRGLLIFNVCLAEDDERPLSVPRDLQAAIRWSDLERQMWAVRVNTHLGQEADF
jgi:hypothetical protein